MVNSIDNTDTIWSLQAFGIPVDVYPRLEDKIKSTTLSNIPLPDQSASQHDAEPENVTKKQDLEGKLKCICPQWEYFS